MTSDFRDSSFRRVSGGRSQSPLLLQAVFHALEYDTIDYVTNRNDQNHDGDDGAHVVQVAAHHQDLAEPKAQIKHFSGDEGAPGEGPSLLQTRDNEGKTRRQQDIPEQLKAFASELGPGN